MAPLSYFSTAAVALLGLGVSAQRVPPPINPTLFTSLSAQDKLVWTDCYDGFKCARLRVNADVSGKNKKDKVELAIVKLPATSGNKTGTLVYSGGGYSAANTNSVVQIGYDLAPLYPNYDMVGIDRRGTGYTTPTLKCFKDNNARNAWIQSEPPILGSSKDALKVQRERAKKFAKGCETYGGNAAKWMGTYPSAVDTYTVMKAIGEKKIHFYGISSGTHTAQTFAALYPEAVGKFVLDSVVRSDVAYTIVDNQPDSIVDAELAIEAFFITCNAVGATACPFKGTSTTVAQLKSRYTAIEKKIKDKPLTNPGFKPFDFSAFHRFLSLVVQDSGVFFPRFGDLLVELEAGKPGAAMQWASGALFANPPPLPPLDQTPPFDHLQAAMCIDAANVNSLKFDKYLEDMIKTSPAIGGLFAQSTLYCTEWKIKPANRFPMEKLNKFCGSKISGKLLYIGNTADGLCPLDSAYYMRNKYFQGSKSTIVIDHAAGHTSVSQGALSGLSGFPSLGIFDIIFRFLNLEQTPAFNSVYLPDLPPFIDREAGYAGLLPSPFGGVTAPAYPIPGKTPPA